MVHSQLEVIRLPAAYSWVTWSQLTFETVFVVASQSAVAPAQEMSVEPASVTGEHITATLRVAV